MARQREHDPVTLSCLPVLRDFADYFSRQVLSLEQTQEAPLLKIRILGQSQQNFFSRLFEKWV